MKKRTLLGPSITLLVACGLLACKDGAGDAADGGSGGSTSADTTGVTSTSTGTGGFGSVTLTLDTFEIGPGEEVFKCQNFANPWGETVEVQAFESHMTPGSHHLLLFYGGTGEDGPLHDCSGLEFDSTPYSTQRSDDEVSFPPGVAAQIPSTTGFRIQSHYLNVTSETITATVTVTMHLADPATVTDHAGVLFIVQPDIHVAPHSSQVISYDCTVPFDLHVMKAASHMHQHAKLFTSTVAGEPFYETSDWDEPEPALFDPPRLLKAGDALHFECTYQNDGDTPLTFGESAETNEMCILGAAFYPAPAGFPTITCN